MRENKLVILISKNLMFLPRIEAAAGSKMKVRRLTSASQIEKTIQSFKISNILVDLEEDSDFWKPLLSEVKRRADEKVAIAAYGPHEDEASMSEARALGCDPVLAKGAFIRQLKSVLFPTNN